MDVKEVLLVVECKLLLLFFNQQGAVELQRCDSETQRQRGLFPVENIPSTAPLPGMSVYN